MAPAVVWPYQKRQSVSSPAPTMKSERGCCMMQDRYLSLWLSLICMRGFIFVVFFFAILKMCIRDRITRARARVFLCFGRRDLATEEAKAPYGKKSSGMADRSHQQIDGVEVSFFLRDSPGQLKLWRSRSRSRHDKSYRRHHWWIGRL